jgi:TonB family protein
MNKKKRADGACRRIERVAAFLSIMSAAALMAAPVTAQAPDAPAASPPPAPQTSEPVDIEVFHGVQILAGPSSNLYPSNEVLNGREGWVRLNMMIDPKGKPYEVMVMDSSGNPAFEKAALKAVEKVQFSPARRGDTPIDSSYMLKLKFAIKDLAKGGSQKFGTRYRKFTQAITAGDKAAADLILPKLEAENLYEEAFEHYARYYYFQKWGSPAEQLKELELAIAGEKNAEYLPKEAFTSALMAIFTLQAKDKDLGGALATWAILDPLVPKDRREDFAGVANQIKALQQSNQPLRYDAVIGEDSNWTGDLLRNRFSVDVTSGAVNEIKLRCEKQYLFFKYQPELQYSIGQQKDQCGLEIVGDPGTRFVLVQ